ncbi:ribonuclease D [Clostridium botulinum]
MNNVKIYIHDLTEFDVDFITNECKFIAIDTETTGLDPLLDKLCLIQICTGENIFILKYDNNIKYNNLIKIMENKDVLKVFHHANFDLRFLMKNLKLESINNVACTKISAKLLNGINENSSLKYLVKKYLDIDIDKSMQMSDWSNYNLSLDQIQYAVSDVIYLYKLWIKIKRLLKNEALYDIANSCFNYLPINAKLHNNGIENIFIY